MYNHKQLNRFSLFTYLPAISHTTYSYVLLDCFHSFILVYGTFTCGSAVNFSIFLYKKVSFTFLQLFAFYIKNRDITSGNCIKLDVHFAVAQGKEIQPTYEPYALGLFGKPFSDAMSGFRQVFRVCFQFTNHSALSNWLMMRSKLLFCIN